MPCEVLGYDAFFSIFISEDFTFFLLQSRNEKGNDRIEMIGYYNAASFAM